MDTLTHLALGFGAVSTPINLLYCFGGVLLGTLIGVLPGLGPVATIAMLLPATYALPPLTALIMLAGIYYGAQYGGSTTAILINLPGESSSVITALDGYQLARAGKAGTALATAAIGSFFAGTVTTLLLGLAAPPLAVVALQFGPAEYFSLMIIGLIISIVLARGSLLKAFGMVMLGLLLGLVGTDVNSGMLRFTLGMPELASGLGFVAVAMGVFGIADIIRDLCKREERHIIKTRMTGLFLTRDDLRKIINPILRGTSVGALLGILPGSGSTLSSFAAYALEKKISRTPERFGHGALEGVAAPESANNAGAQMSFIPLLTLGIPSNPVMALMAGALIIQGIQPGPAIMVEQPTLFWGLIVSMWIGNLFLLFLNLPLVGVWAKLLTIPYQLLFPGIVVFCAVGALSLNNSEFDVFIVAAFGLMGFVLTTTGCEGAPLLLGFILGPLMEENFRRALVLSGGDPTVFIREPISAVLLVIAAAMLILVLAPSIRSRREEAFHEDA